MPGRAPVRTHLTSKRILANSLSKRSLKMHSGKFACATNLLFR